MPAFGARARAFRTRSHQFGPRYGALAAVRALVRRLDDRLEDRLLAAEGERGIMGLAHLGYRDHSPAENRAVWSAWDWSKAGEEWTESPEWKASLIEVLRAEIPPGGVVLEIGPGAGRWSETLRERAERLVLVDVTERALDLCRERLGDDPNVTYVLTDGSTCPGVRDGSVDAVWSFDAFVHIAPIHVAGYLGEIARVLKPGGVAIVHHAGRSARPRKPSWRSPMTAALFANLAHECGLVVERQFDSWGGGRFDVRPAGDVISVLHLN